MPKICIKYRKHGHYSFSSRIDCRCSVTVNTSCQVFKRGTKSERILPKNQHTQMKFLKFENWVNGEVSKIGH